MPSWGIVVGSQWDVSNAGRGEPAACAPSRSVDLRFRSSCLRATEAVANLSVNLHRPPRQISPFRFPQRRSPSRKEAPVTPNTEAFSRFTKTASDSLLLLLPVFPCCNSPASRSDRLATSSERASCGWHECHAPWQRLPIGHNAHSRRKSCVCRFQRHEHADLHNPQPCSRRATTRRHQSQR